jgi:hypothetical protein
MTIHAPGLRAVVVNEPWQDSYGVILGSTGHRPFLAESVEGGRIVYKDIPDGVDAKPFLTLSRSELDALSRALLADARPEDATLDALKDSRVTRDRLLALIEQRGLR